MDWRESSLVRVYVDEVSPAIAAPPLYHWYSASVMFMPSSSDTPVASAEIVSPSVSVPVISRCPVGASLTSVTVTVTM